MENKECTLDNLYSCTRKMENPFLYKDVIMSEEDKKNFFKYALNHYDQDTSMDWQEAEKLFADNMNQGNNLYESIAENLIQEMYKKHRKEISIPLPVGIIQNQPIIQGEASEVMYSIGTGILYNNSFVITATHVLENDWFEVIKNNNIVSSGEIPKHIIDKQLQEKSIASLKKVLTYVPFKNEGGLSTIEVCSFIEDNIKYKGVDKITYEITEIIENGVDIGIAKIKNPINSKFQVIFSADDPLPEQKLCAISIEKEEKEERLFLIDHPKVLRFDDIKALKSQEKYQKMFFLENAMIPGTSGSPILASISESDKTLLIFGVFNKKIEVEDEGRVKLFFAFSPIKNYVETLVKKIEELSL
jgi:hypothetical protein